ncbi:MAG TPA: FecR domain-containing protein, partial [Chryseosolibacter sp.]
SSRLKYKEHYQGAALREVYLKGEAFFQVAKNPTQPFLVHSNEVVTRVLGTSFRVKAPDDGQGEITVSVKTGTVSVYTLGEVGEEPQKNAVILLPNQQATYMRDHESFGKGLIAEPEIILSSLNEADFTFDDTPIAQVFEVLENAYGIDIIFDEEVMNNCFITAPLGSEPLFEKLKIICRAIGARYETIDAKVVVTSAGCLNL